MLSDEIWVRRHILFLINSTFSIQTKKTLKYYQQQLSFYF